MAPSAHAIGDAGLVALAPALRGRPALEMLSFMGSPLSNEGIAALVARRRRRRQVHRRWLRCRAVKKLSGRSTSTTPRSPTPRLRGPRRCAQQRHTSGAQGDLSAANPCERHGEGRRVGGTRGGQALKRSEFIRARVPEAAARLVNAGDEVRMLCDALRRIQLS